MDATAPVIPFSPPAEPQDGVGVGGLGDLPGPVGPAVAASPTSFDPATNIAPSVPDVPDVFMPLATATEAASSFAPTTAVACNVAPGAGGTGRQPLPFATGGQLSGDSAMYAVTGGGVSKPDTSEDDGFIVVRSKKRVRVDEDERAVAPTAVAAPFLHAPIPRMATPSAPLPSMVGVASGRRDGRPERPQNHLLGRGHDVRRSGMTYHPGPAALLRMSPLEDGQVYEARQYGMSCGFNMLDGAEPVLPAAGPHASPMTAAGPTPPSHVTPRAAVATRNATPGPSGPALAMPALNGPGRAPLQDITPHDDQENLPPMPVFPRVIRDLPPILRLQTVDFLGRLPVRVRDTLLETWERGLLPNPTVVPDFPRGFWPAAIDWVEQNAWLWAGPMTGPEPADGLPALPGGDVAMRDNNLPLAALPELDHMVQLPPPVGDLPGGNEQGMLDTQNLIVLPNCVPNGGRQIAREFPLTRATVHGAAQIQPPLDMTQTPEPPEGFPRIYHGDPETLFAGWEAERIRQVSSLEHETSVIISVHAPAPVHAGDGWALVKAVEEFVVKLCGATDIYVAPVEVQNPAPRYNVDDVQTWTPLSFPAWNLPADAVDILTAQQSFSTPGFTAHFFPTLLRFSEFLGRIEGYTKNDVVALTAFVKSRFESDEVRAIIRKYVTRNPLRNTEPLEDAVQRIVDSVHVEIETQPTTLQPNALVFVDMPAHSIDAARAFRKDMKAVSWKSLIYGNGLLVYLAPCRGCSSVTHRPDFCPFPDVTGWLGPTHADVSRLVARAGGRGRGTPILARGRGRGIRG